MLYPKFGSTLSSRFIDLIVQVRTKLLGPSQPKAESANGCLIPIGYTDNEGKLKVLTNDSSCGMWVTADSDGSLVIEVAYDGCYITKMDNYYAMTMFLEHNTTGAWEVYEKEDLRCPVSQVTVQCTKDGWISVTIFKDITVPPLVLSSVRFPRGRSPECSPVTQSDALLIFHFPLSACGTTRKEDGVHVIYENDLVADMDIRTWSGGSIFRDSTFRLQICCSFTASGFVPLDVDVFTPRPPPPASSSGSLTLEMRIAQDPQYRQYYARENYPVVKRLREPLYVEVCILHRHDSALTLILDQCWATPSAEPLKLPQWPILVNSWMCSSKFEVLCFGFFIFGFLLPMKALMDRAMLQ
ncbi:zona pellucida sperm-binding protein 4-like [Rhinophrynus dorsalis]